MNSKRTSFIAFICLLIVACESEKPTEPSENGIYFTLVERSNGNGRILEDEPSAVIVSIDNDEGDNILEEEKVVITKFGEGYVVDPILLVVGNYNLTKFLVLNEGDEVIYATPLEGSETESFVNDPLPISFDISADETTQLEIEVISTESLDPEDLGYASLSFEIIPTFDILVSVFFQDDSGSEFVESELNVYGNNNFLYAKTLGDSINLVMVEDSFDEIKLEFTLESGSNQVVTISSDNLTQYRTVPLEIVFDHSIDLSKGLIAYYPLDGDASDANGEYNGVLGDGSGSNEPTVTTDRNGNSNSAFEFSGNNNYIDLSTNNVFDITDNSEYSISVWVNPSESNNEAIISKYIAASNNRMWLLRVWEDQIRYDVHDGTLDGQDKVLAPVLEGWQHIVVTLDDNFYYLFINGELKNQTEKTITPLSDSPTAKALIGAVHHSNVTFDVDYHGKIDEVRLYNRVLNANEITYLSNQ